MTDPSFAHLHDDARAVLTSWSPSDDEQDHLRRQYLVFLDEHPDALSRDCRVGHLTASALVVNADRDRVLLTLHPKVGRWLQLGGHCEASDRGLRDAAGREAREESGIREVEVSPVPIAVDRHAVRCSGGMSEHLDVQYLVVVPNDAREEISVESDDLRWFALNGLPEGLDASVLRQIDAMTRMPAW